VAGKVTDRDLGWKAIVSRAAQIGRASTRVGIIGDEAQAERGAGVTQAELGAIHEFGAPKAGIPQRSFIRRAVEKSKRIDGAIEHLAEQVIDGKESVQSALGQLGAVGAAEVKATITEGQGVPPPLEAETVKRKGSDRPRVDSGRLLGSIFWDIEGSK
jgi:hypothetical protein